MEQTAVEWLQEKLENGIIAGEAWKDLLIVAKAMEKRQIEEALLTGLVHWNVDKPISEYYNETYSSGRTESVKSE